MPPTPIGNGDLTQRLAPMPGLPARTPAALPRNDLGAGLAGPSDDGGCDPSYPTVCIPSPPPDLD